MKRLLLALFALTPLASADFVPDNLDGACWEPKDLDIPILPSIELPALGICWTDCNTTTNNTQVFFSPPVPNFCGQYLVQVTVTNPAGTTIFMDGLGILDYTRTWEETDAAGDSHQVWRFTFKIDARAFPPVAGCPAAPCLNVWDTAFYYGHVDYARDCTTGEWQSSLSMFHNCDLFIHQQSISDRPGTYHPNEMYAVVAPHTTANPFVPADIIPPSGPLTAEAVRNVSMPFCTAEERIDSGALAYLAGACFCPLAPTPLTQSASFLTGDGTCPDTSSSPSSFDSLFFSGSWPVIPWIHMVGTSLGSWTTPATYPGNERLWANEGLFAYHDSCVGVTGDPADFAEIFYGVTTRGGWDVIPFDSDLTQTFLDLADNYSLNLADPPTFPIVGSIRPTDHLIYVNVP